MSHMDEGRKRVLGIIAGILVGGRLKTTEDLVENRSSPRTEPVVAAAVQWAERIMSEDRKRTTNRDVLTGASGAGPSGPRAGTRKQTH